MQTQPVELVGIYGDDLTPAQAAWYSTASALTDEKLRRVPAMLRTLALGDPPENLPHCYDAETEVFTADGWIKWSDVTQSTILAAISEDFSISYEQASEVVARQYSGVMYGAHSQHVDFLVTPLHRMFVSRRTNNGYKPYEVLTPRGIKGKCYRLNTCVVDRSGIGGSYDEGWLYGFFLGDGHRESRHKINFRLKKRRKIDALLSNLDVLGMHYTSKLVDEGVTEIIVLCDDNLFFGKAHDKEIDGSVFTKSLQYREGVFDGLMSSDAHNKRGADSFVYTTTSCRLAVSLDRLCTTIGKYSKIKMSSTGLHKVHVLARCVEPVVNPPQSSIPTDFEVEYDGMIYCAVVSTGLLMVRRNGCVMVSGNSVPFEHTLIQFRVTSEIASHIHIVKHRIGVSVSSQSQRYMEIKEDLYYIPDDWPSNLQAVLKAHVLSSFDLYHRLIDDLQAAGINRKRAKESARFALTYATQIHFLISFNLLSFVHFQFLRNSQHAQDEIHLIADEMLKQVKATERFSNALGAWGL